MIDINQVCSFLLVVAGIVYWAVMGDYLVVACVVVVLIGIGCNTTVMALNNGKMPVKTPRLSVRKRVRKSPEHHMASRNTRLIFLSDVFDVGPVGVASIGDLLMVFGCSALIVVVFTNAVPQ